MPENTFDGQVTVYLSIKYLNYALLSHSEPYEGLQIISGCSYSWLCL